MLPCSSMGMLCAAQVWLCFVAGLRTGYALQYTGVLVMDWGLDTPGSIYARLWPGDGVFCVLVARLRGHGGSSEWSHKVVGGGVGACGCGLEYACVLQGQSRSGR